MSDFNSVFEGIDKVRSDIDNELSLLQQINKEQKIELEKAKQFNKKNGSSEHQFFGSFCC